MIWARVGITSHEAGVSSRPPPFHPQILTPLLNQPRKHISNLRRPPPGRRPGLRSLNQSLQQPQNSLCKRKEESVEIAASKPTTTKLVVPAQSSACPPEDISDLLDHLPLQVHVELTRRLLTSISSFPTRAARPRAVLKTVIFFVAEYGSTT
jgi:hypothetical protein